MQTLFRRRTIASRKSHRRAAPFLPAVEALEDRNLLSIDAGPIVNPANGHTYYLLTPSNWTAAENEAVSLGGHLATINDAEENAWVVNTFVPLAQWIWIGLNDTAVEGTFAWTSGETVTYTNWAPGEPNGEEGGSPGPDDYAYIYGVHTNPERRHKWNDTDDNFGGPLGCQGVVEVATQPGIAPTVSGVFINDGSDQRSQVTSLTVLFSGIVTLDPGAFELRDQAGSLVGVAVSTGVLDGRTVATLTFTGPGILAGSLADGSYTLTIRGDLVHGPGGDLDGDGDGMAGGDHLTAFHRLFGDTDGDQDVDFDDLGVLLTTLGRSAGEDGFLWYLDYDGDDTVGLTDWTAFGERYIAFLT